MISIVKHLLSQQWLNGYMFRVEHINPLKVPGGAAPCDVDLTSAGGSGCCIGGHGDVADPIGLATPCLPREGVDKEALWEVDAGGAVEEAGDGVVLSGREADLLEEVVLAVSAAAGVLGVLVVVEGIVGGLAEVSAAEDELPEGEVEGV